MKKIKEFLKIDEEQRYPFTNLILIFTTLSVVGWIWEVMYRLIRKGYFANRGFLFGPWVPIYGIGAMLVILISKKLKRDPIAFTIVTAITCSGLEYLISLILEYVFHLKFWDYKRYFMNLNGRICLESVLGFTIAGLIAGYLILPRLNKLYNKIKPKLKTIICIILSVLFLTDLTYSIIHPNTGKGISWQVNK
ncbi:MAG: putative ABC transporter permease [Bacilli bacterium]|nr:putative ABC transporter permease [Bacilli bacterium]